ncbi:MAG: hypothetical protein PSU94_17260 [Lacunisphaera sp.]|nr:hypothetical protein [Lacunisphaera sp.]
MNFLKSLFAPKSPDAALHPAQKHLDAAAALVDQWVQVEVAGEKTVTHISAGLDEVAKALAELDAGLGLCPLDPDLLVAKACVQHASAQFKSAEETLDLLLQHRPDHFEARAWKDHWDTWSNALRFPRWDERQTRLHPVMQAYLRTGHRVQLVRSGLSKIIAIVTEVQGPPIDPKSEIKLSWVLSRTPAGPLVAYYVKIIEPVGEPSTMEAFLAISQPALFSPMEGYYLARQLALTPFCYVVFVSGNSVALNRQIRFGPKTRQQLAQLAADVTATTSYLPQPEFRTAMQWHMQHFDMNRVVFEN